MSPGKLKGSRSKDRSSRTPNERHKSSKLYTSCDSDAISQKSGCSPMSGTIHSLESILVRSPAHQNGGRFRNIDDRNDQCSRSPRAVTEYDLFSNNGSCSGESEDPKEKSSPTLRQELGACDSEKREKIRQKNERKHQRQKERRAQELHERCCGYLTSRKLEGLGQQLVAMGFSSERATLALILNEGKVEKSVAWLFDVSEEEARRRGASVENGSNLKIDISEELCRVAVMEVRYKSSKQEVERAIVSCEGDIDKAEEILKAQKQERPCTPPKNEADTPGRDNLAKQESPTIPVTTHKSVAQHHTTPTRTGAAVMMPRDVGFGGNLQALKSTQPGLMNGWISNDSFPPLPSAEAGFGMATKHGKHTPQRATLDQADKMGHVKQLNSVPRFFLNRNGLSPRWHAKSISGIDVTTSGQPYSYSGKKSPTPVPFGLSGKEQLRPVVHSLPSSLKVPSSLGLFSGWTSGGTMGSSGGGLDNWNMGSSMAQCDYATIDWSIRPDSLCSKRNGLWLGISSCMRDDGWDGTELRNGGVMFEAGSPASEGDWTSPFAGNDIFSAPRQFMASSL